MFNKLLINITTSYLFFHEIEIHFTPLLSTIWLASSYLLSFNSSCLFAWRINITKTNNESCRNIITKASTYLSATHYLLTYVFS